MNDTAIQDSKFKLDALLTCVVGATTLFVRNGDNQAGLACEKYIQDIKDFHEAALTAQRKAIVDGLPEKIPYRQDPDGNYVTEPKAPIREIFNEAIDQVKAQIEAIGKQ